MRSPPYGRTTTQPQIEDALSPASQDQLGHRNPIFHKKNNMFARNASVTHLKRASACKTGWSLQQRRSACHFPNFLHYSLHFKSQIVSPQHLHTLSIANYAPNGRDIACNPVADAMANCCYTPNSSPLQQFARGSIFRLSRCHRVSPSYPMSTITVPKGSSGFQPVAVDCAAGLVYVLDAASKPLLVSPASINHVCCFIGLRSFLVAFPVMFACCADVPLTFSVLC